MTTTNSPSPIVTNVDVVESPSVEGKIFKTILHYKSLYLD
jgi:hypothetical protein